MYEFDINQFNINDYIWYIVGGIALLFVLIGFIADKSGLAKKTFSKESNNSKKVMSKEKDNTSTIIQNNLMESIDTDNDNLAETTELVEGDVFSDDENISEDVNFEQQANADEEDFIEPIDSLSSEGPIYLNADEEEKEDTDEFTLENSNLQVDQAEQVDQVEQDEQAEQADVSDEDDSVWDIDSDQIVVDDENSSVATDNAEQEWGMTSSNDFEDANSLENVELPNLEDIGADAEDDVWKF